MTKVSEDDDDVIYSGKVLIIRAMRRTNGAMPAMVWFQGLDDRGVGQVAAAAAVVETNLNTGRQGGRAGKVRNSSMSLWELKVTKPGSTAPHHRLLYRREQNTLWAAYGFTKQSNELRQADIDKADSVTENWLSTRGAK